MSTRRRTYSLLETMTMGEVLFNGVFRNTFDENGGIQYQTADLLRDINFSKETILISVSTYNKSFSHDIPNYSTLIVGNGTALSSMVLTNELRDFKISGLSTVELQVGYTYSATLVTTLLIIAIPRTDV